MEKLLPRFNQVSASFFRDANRVPITTDGLITTDAQVLSGNNATVAVPIFGITGSVEIRGLWGIVTTALQNHTAAAWRVNDQTAQLDITLNTGTSLTNAPVGSLIVKKGLAAAALTLKSAAAGAISEPTTLETNIHSPFVLTQKTGGIATNIEYVYATTDTPTTGAIQFFLRWLPLSSDAAVTAL